MNFLPEDYKAPNSSGFYTKLQDGENRIRILSKPVMGWEDWIDKKPYRFRMDKKPNANDPKQPVRHFWAFIVFNYTVEEIQIMEITQSTVRKSIEGLCRDADWGAPFHYDIKIIKTGQQKDTEYTVNPVPHKPIDDYIVQAFKERPINLEALFENKDPFSSEWANPTPMEIDPTRFAADAPKPVKTDIAVYKPHPALEGAVVVKTTHGTGGVVLKAGEQHVMAQ